MKRLLSGLFIVLLTASAALAGGQSQSSKTVQNVIDRARSYLNETKSSTTGFFTDTELLRWTDEGVRDIVAKTHCLQQTDTITLSGSTFEYTFSGASNYLTIETCVYYNGTDYKGLPRIDIPNIGRTATSSGTPDYWYEWGDKIGIWPLPTSSYSGNSIYVYYVPQPTTLTATTDPIQIPAIYDNPLIWYVCAQGKIKDRKFQEAALFMQRYDATVDRYRVDLVKEPARQEGK